MDNPLQYNIKITLCAISKLIFELQSFYFYAVRVLDLFYNILIIFFVFF